MDLVKPKKTKKTKAKKTKKVKRKKQLVNKSELPSLRLSENAEEFYLLIDRIYKDADDSALAAAKFESDLISRHVDLDDEGQEIPDEFNREFFQGIHRKLLELRALKDFAEAFNLGQYIPEIMTARINSLFGGGGKRTAAIIGRPQKNFYGSDEDYLVHTLREKMRGKSQ